jgi:hypothetical protein
MELKHYAYYVSSELFSFPYSNTWYGEWFTVSQLHHETYVVALFALGIGLLVGKKCHNKK